MVALSYDVGTRIQALTLLEAATGIRQITEITGFSKSSIYRIKAVAKQRGYNPQVSKVLLLKYVEDAPRSGRPIKATKEVEDIVVSLVSKNSSTRAWSAQRIASTITAQTPNGISARTVHRILRRKGYKPLKYTRKPGLTDAAKAVRLKWCLEHQDWTLEDWKNVIWSDETAVTMGGQRGRLRCWRTTSEAYNHHCIKRRWKGFKQFMFWGCFSYDKKGPCYIWENETPKEKKESVRWLEEQNKVLEPICKFEWELEMSMRRLRVSARNIPGPKPRWVWKRETGKLVRDASKGGIDWYRYYIKVLKALLLPFAVDCKANRPRTIVQEDNASPHAHHHQHRVYVLWDVLRMIWPANSPDINAIEPTWFWMKRETTKHGAATSIKQMKEDWRNCWDSLPQRKIQEWIERIPIHIKKIIELEGGNEYKEGVGRRKRKRNTDRVYS
jgi:transposase